MIIYFSCLCLYRWCWWCCSTFLFLFWYFTCLSRSLCYNNWLFFNFSWRFCFRFCDRFGFRFFLLWFSFLSSLRFLLLWFSFFSSLRFFLFGFTFLLIFRLFLLRFSFLFSLWFFLWFCFSFRTFHDISANDFTIFTRFRYKAFTTDFTTLFPDNSTNSTLSSCTGIITFITSPLTTYTEKIMLVLGFSDMLSLEGINRYK